MNTPNDVAPGQSIIVIGAKRPIGEAIRNTLRTDHASWLERLVMLDLPDFDVTDRRTVREMIREHRPATVFQVGTFTNVDEAERSPNTCATVNVRAAENLADACRSSGARLIHLSSSTVFDGEAATTAWAETDVPRPASVCGKTLLEAEQAVQEWERALVVRTGEIFGRVPGEGRPCFVNAIRRMAKRTRRLSVAEGYRHSLVYAEDLARTLVWLAKGDERGILHVANLGNATRLELAEEVVSLEQLPVELLPISEREYGMAVARPDSAALDTSRYQGLPDAPPLDGWRDALKRFLDAEK